MFQTRWLGGGLALAAALFVVAPSAMPGGDRATTAKLPEAVAKALQEAFPKAVIAKVGVKSNSTGWVNVGKKGEMHVLVAADGTIVQIGTKADVKDFSEAAAAAIKAAAPGAKIIDVLKSENRATTTDGKSFTKREKPRIFFNVTLTKDNKIGTIMVADDDGAVQGQGLEWTDRAPEAATFKRAGKGEPKAVPDLEGKYLIVYMNLTGAEKVYQPYALENVQLRKLGSQEFLVGKRIFKDGRAGYTVWIAASEVSAFHVFESAEELKKRLE
ncbi:MAG: hypothetical protein HYR84_15455 [Planctomycetes bacterium]|nr:hypothetical protein [Planctomycetota bacterium]